MTPELAAELDKLHRELKETLRMQTALEQILKNTSTDCHGLQILADVIKVRLGVMDLSLIDLIEENTPRQYTKPTKESMTTGVDHLFATLNNEVIDADARQAAGGV